MKKNLLIAAGFAVLISSCHESSDRKCPPVTTSAPATEVASLKHFLDSSHITAVADNRGFYYSISDSGSGTKPSSCANVTIKYSGKLTNGTTFDSSNRYSSSLTQLIAGWQEGVPLIAPGGTITLYLPPTLGYGVEGYPDKIPGNANLIFKITLISVD